MKKLFKLVVSLALLVCISSTALAFHDSLDEQWQCETLELRLRQYAFDDNVFVSENKQWLYELTDNNAARILYCAISAGEIIIPSEVDGYAVEVIGEYAFSGPPMNTKLKKLVIPDGVKIIGDNAFEKCWSLEEIVLPESITSLGDGAFLGCESLKRITLPGSLTSINEYMFYECESLEYINLPAGITSIGYSAFSDSGLMDLVIPEGVTTIDGHAFSRCHNLASLSLPASLREMGEDVLLHVNKGVTITISPDNPNLSLVDGVLISKNQHKVIHCTAAFSGGSYTVPEGIKTIDSYAFDGIDNLTELILPASLTAIGDRSPNGGSSLKAYHVDEKNPVYASVDGALYDKKKKTLLFVPWACEESVFTVAPGTRCIEYRAFSFCTNIEEIIIPDSVEDIEGDAFVGCEKLKTIVLPSGLKSIGNDAFALCRALEHIEIPNSIKSLKSGTFNQCHNLRTIIIPASVKEMEEEVFRLCSSEDIIILAPSGSCAEAYALENGFKHFDCASLEEYEIALENAIDYRYFRPSDLEQVEAFGVVKESEIDGAIWKYAVIEDDEVVLVACESELNVLHIPGKIDGYSVTAIADDAIDKRIHDLDELVIPDSVRTIGCWSFANCYYINKVVIPKGVEVIGKSAFANTDSYGFVLPASLKTIGENALGEMNLIELSPDNEYFEIIDGLLYEKNPKRLVCNTCDFNAIDYAVLEGTERIDNYAFGYCESLECIFIPASVREISDSPFFVCSNLRKIKVDPANPYYRDDDGVLFAINENALLKCPSAAVRVKYEIPEGTKKIADYAFQDCTRLEEIIIPEGITSIVPSVFDNCSSLRSIVIPQGVEYIAGYAFSNCTALREIVIPESVTEISTIAFENCSGELTIIGQAGSYAERYAKEQGLNFVQQESE